MNLSVWSSKVLLRILIRACINGDASINNFITKC